jgi:LysM repeat protein
MLPVGGIIVGVIGLLLGGFALVQASKANKLLADQIQPKLEKIDAIELQANSAVAAAEKASKELATRMREVQAGFDQIGPIIGELRTSVTKLEESAKRPAPAAGKKGGGEPAVAGPGEYIVKSGDTGMKIANANGVSVQDLQSVNPGVNWGGLKVGQKLKLPAKR